MSEWWTYHLRDFLLFTPRTYYRLFELYNAAIWPVQVLALGLGAAILFLRRRGSVAAGRAIAGILAACWLFVAIAFHAARYATINTAAVWLAWAFAVETVLLIWVGVVRGGMAFERTGTLTERVGLGVFLFALVLEPLIGPLLGRGWRQVELFGVAPDPTAIATLGVLLLARTRRRWVLMVLPIVWCVVTGATLHTMKAADFWVAPLMAAVATVAAVIPHSTFRGGNQVRDPSLRSG